MLEAWESRQPENLRMTLILVKENYLVDMIEHLNYSRNISKQLIN